MINYEAPGAILRRSVIVPAAQVPNMFSNPVLVWPFTDQKIFPLFVSCTLTIDAPGTGSIMVLSTNQQNVNNDALYTLNNFAILTNPGDRYTFWLMPNSNSVGTAYGQLWLDSSLDTSMILRLSPNDPGLIAATDMIVDLYYIKVVN